MIPLVGDVTRAAGACASSWSAVAARGHERAPAARSHYKFGTMIEVPRAALIAGEIAEMAEFFSFGTNDLTQTTFGYSPRRRRGQVPRQLRRAGDPAGQPVPDARPRRRGPADADGRRGGPRDPPGPRGRHLRRARRRSASIAFCHQLGLNYVSASPFRVPVARLAAAQAALKARGPTKLQEVGPAQFGGSDRDRATAASDAPQRELRRVRLTPASGGPRTARGCEDQPLAVRRAQQRRLAARRPQSRRPAPDGVPARPRPGHPLQGVSAAQAQDPGVHRAEGRPLPHPPDPHDGSDPGRADDRAGAAAERGSDRGHRPGARPRAHAVRARWRGRDGRDPRPSSATTSRACGWWSTWSARGAA